MKMTSEGQQRKLPLMPKIHFGVKVEPGWRRKETQIHCSQAEVIRCWRMPKSLRVQSKYLNDLVLAGTGDGSQVLEVESPSQKMCYVKC